MTDYIERVEDALCEAAYIRVEYGENPSIQNPRDVAIAALSALKPGDVLPGGLVVEMAGAVEAVKEGLRVAGDKSKHILALEAENFALAGRMCVNCGRTFPASHDPAIAPADCPLPEVCTIDLTLTEAFEHWRGIAHQRREENARLKEATLDVLASLVAAISLLERGGKRAAPSDRMFAQMLDDYRASINRARDALGGDNG